MVGVRPPIVGGEPTIACAVTIIPLGKELVGPIEEILSITGREVTNLISTIPLEMGLEVHQP